VRSVRLWFLLLLVVLLPVRGVVAAAMLCPVAKAGVQAQVRGHTHSMGHEAIDHSMAHGLAGDHGHAAAGVDGSNDHAASDKCNLCSASCSLTPLMSKVPTLPEPLDLPRVEFPHVSSPSPSFVSEGPERPPRTI